MIDPLSGKSLTEVLCPVNGAEKKPTSEKANRVFHAIRKTGGFVATATLGTASFLNQKPVNSFVGTAALCGVITTVMLTVGFMTPLGFVGTILLLPVIKAVASRTTTIAGNILWNLSASARNRDSFFHRMKDATAVHNDPFTVSVASAMASEAVWEVFSSVVLPAPVAGVTKTVVKGAVTIAPKQLAKASTLFGYNRIFGTKEKSASECLSLKAGILGIIEGLGGDFAVEGGCYLVGCHLFGKAALRTGGIKAGGYIGSLAWDKGAYSVGVVSSYISNTTRITSLFLKNRMSVLAV